jgi:hypothetical protein
MMSQPLISSNRGVAIIAVTMVVVVATLLGGVILSMVTQDAELSERTYADKAALYLAESAKERGYSEILHDVTGTFVPANVGDPPAIIDGAIGVPDANVTPGAANTYHLEVTREGDAPMVVQMVATAFGPDQNDRTVTVVAEVMRENVFIWNNAIFGGSGQDGGVINGNCSIHGSVHLIGDGVGVGNNAIAAFDLSGTALMHNNYAGMPAELLAQVPELPMQDFGGETDIYTLNAKLRVKNGAVGVSGNSEIGESNIVGNTYKETLNGIYIETDIEEIRWTGNQVEDGVPDPDNVQSDNGTNELYDLGDTVHFPELRDESYTDPETGIAYAHYEDYFNDYSVKLPPLTLDSSCTAATQVQNYYAANPDPNVVVGVDGCNFQIEHTEVINGIPTVNSLSYTVPSGNNDDTAEIVANGMFTVEGDVSFGENGMDIRYEGEATFYAAGNGSDGSGNMYFHSNFLPSGTNNFTAEGYVFGFMAKNDLEIATGPGDSQLSLAGVYYAQGQITSAKQNEILGAFASRYFDMGTNVPKIYQIPNLANNLSPGLIGSDPVWVTTGFDERHWRVD